MDYEQFKAAFAEDLKTNLQKLGIEADVSEHHIEKLNDSHRLIPAYPVRALFEGIINSVAHRDYTLPGSIQIDMFRDRLEISSPGAFYRYLVTGTVKQFTKRPFYSDTTDSVKTE